ARRPGPGARPAPAPRPGARPGRCPSAPRAAPRPSAGPRPCTAGRPASPGPALVPVRDGRRAQIPERAGEPQLGEDVGRLPGGAAAVVVVQPVPVPDLAQPPHGPEIDHLPVSGVA